MDDNLYPNNGEYYLPTEPAEQKLARLKEQAKVLEELKPLEEAVQHWKARATFYDSVDSIAVDINTKPEDFLKAWNHAQAMKRDYEAEVDWLEDLIEQYKR